MTFGTDLQQTTSHRALVQLQEAEIQLLELIKKCLNQRVRSDREYANALSVILNHSQKFDSSANTPFFQVWQTVVKETEGLIALLREHAERVSSCALERLIHIIAEKRSAKKFYIDERTRIDNEFQKVKDEVNKLRQEYEKCVNKQIQERLKYEDLASKGVVGRKLEEAKGKVIKSSLRLYKIHNEYVAALREASLHQENYMNTTLPGILDYQEEVQKYLVSQCKTVLMKYSELTDLSTSAHAAHFTAIRTAVDSLSPEEEYQQFSRQNKGEMLSPIEFRFDGDLLQSYKGNLNPEELAVNDLSIEYVNHSYSRVKEQYNDCKQKIMLKRSLVTTQKEQMAKMQEDKDGLDDMQKNSYHIHKRAVLELEREIQELHCRQLVLEGLNSLYDRQLSALGDGDLPDGVNFTDASGLPAARPVERDKKKNKERDKEKEPERPERPVPPTPPRTPEKPQSDEVDESLNDSGSSATHPDIPGKSFANNLQGKMTNLISRIRKPSTGGSPAPPRPPAKDFREDQSYIQTEVGPNRQSEFVQHDWDQAGQEQRAHNANSLQHNANSSEGYHQMIPSPGRPLDEEEWFHGVLPREEVQRLLTQNGDYLVRESKNRKTGEIQYVLSVFWNDHKHFIIQGQENCWRFEGEQYSTVQDLLISQHNSGVPVTRKSGAILKHPIKRETWELRNDDIDLGQKIGNGNFGDVFKGVYKPDGMEVAVKTCRETLSDEAKKKFLQEGRILKQYEHKNIVRFIGIAAQRHPVMILMEFVAGGALLTFLKKQGAQQTKRQLVRMCSDAAAGMAYLESRNCIHRDLAARNCLVGKNNVVKISDFGMSREEEEYVVSGGLKQIPIKWTAPEALNFGTYTSACDVWSFGVLMWEVFSFGQSPYPGLTNTQARERVDDGYRMPMPDGMPTPAYDLQLKTWDQEPKNRPHFDEIHAELERIYKTLPFR